MSTTVEINVKSPAISKLASLLSDEKRTALSLSMGLGVRKVTWRHLQKLAASRHTTAERLGGAITGHLEQATNAVEKASVVANTEGATLTINHPGLGRALHEVTIRPVTARYLTIPLNGLAYGHRVGEFEKGKVILIFKGGHRTGREKPRTEKSDEEKSVRQDLPAFLLLRSVTQRQDRTLLPSNEEWEKGARTDGLEYLNQQGAFT